MLIRETERFPITFEFKELKKSSQWSECSFDTLGFFIQELTAFLEREISVATWVVLQALAVLPYLAPFRPFGHSEFLYFWDFEKAAIIQKCNSTRLSAAYSGNTNGSTPTSFVWYIKIIEKLLAY